MLKKIISCLLISIICLICFSACSDDGVPDGMYSATIEGEPFILYVPEGWSDNRDSGISSAYYSLSDAVMVSARYYTPEGISSGELSLDGYIDQCVAAYNEKYSSFKIVDRKESALGTNKATRLEYTFDRLMETNGVSQTASVTAIHYFALHAGGVVMLDLYGRTETYTASEDYAEMFGQIVSEFVLCDKNEINDVVTDKDTPEGFKRISFDSCQYRFYAPMSWVCNMSDKLTEAYYPESGKPNVTVTSFSPDGTTTPENYFALCETTYKTELSGYELISTEERTVADRRAVSYTYKAVYGEAEYRIMQTVLVYNDLVYSITYTALGEEAFNAHLADVEAMLSYFRFR